MAQIAVVQRESEKLRNMLPAAISHDVRTPLAPGQMQSVKAIADVARQHNALVSNRLDRARLQTDTARLKSDWQTV